MSKAGLLVALLLVLGCKHGEDELARLEATRGSVDRDEAAHQGRFVAAAVGATFKVNDGVRTAAAATAKLQLSDGSALSLREKTLLRFLATPPGKRSRGLDVQTGEVELDVGAQGLEIETSVGPALLDPGTHLRLRRTDRGATFSVEIGTAHLESARRDVKAGESVEVGIGQAVLEPAAPTPGNPERAGTDRAESNTPTPSPTPSSSVTGPADAVADAAADARKQGPALPDVLAAPGDSLIIHDPHPPTVVGFVSTRCAGLTVLEVGSKKRETIGSGRVTGVFGGGSQHYRLSCDQEPKPFAEGTITILADAGTRRLATAAPVNRIDSDGRRYTILYQNLLPKVAVRWPNPPSAGPFVLNVSSQSRGNKSYTASAPTYSLPAGALGEGSYELWFQARGETSRRTSVVVQFDNAAPTASITSPAERGFAPGALVSVSGMALPGWSVSVSGRELPQDAQQRFSGEVAAPSDLGALAIRFSHPQRGVHYYLRRSSR